MSRPRRIPKELQSEWVRRKPMYIDKDDKRYKRYCTQLKQNGFCDAETWSLDSVICQFVLPRLKRFKELNIGYPGGEITWEKWNEILDKMIFAFEFNLVMDDWSHDKPGFDAEYAKFEEGMQLFAKWFRHLWW